MNKTRFFALSTVLAMGLCGLAQAATLTIAANGTLGKVLSGSDPEHASGHGGDVTLKISETATPTAHTATTATYKIPTGALTAVVNGTTYTSNAPASMKVTVPASGADTIYVSGTFTYSGVTATITATLALAKHSLTKAALKHPTAFTPASQPMTGATTATGPGCKASYDSVFTGKTVLALSGTVTASSAAE